MAELTLPPIVNAVVEREIAVTAPIPSEVFGLPQTVLTILNPVLSYIYRYLQKRIAAYIAAQLASHFYSKLPAEQRAFLNDKKAYMEETYNHMKAKLEEAFVGADSAAKAYLPEILVLVYNSVNQGFDMVNAEIKNQIQNAEYLAVKATGKVLNFLFTSDLTIEQIGWRKGPPMSARMIAIYGQYWEQATGLTSNLISGLAYSDAIDSIHVDKGIKEKSELLYKMTHPEEFGATVDQAPVRHRKPYLLLTPDEITDILKITLLAKVNNRNYEGSEEVFQRPLTDIVRNTQLTEERIVLLKRLFFGIREQGDIHFFYKFDPGFLHHGVILTGGLCVEVQNRIFEPTADNPKRVRAVVTPSSLLDVLVRAKHVGLYGYAYDNTYSADVIRSRALWTIGKWDYDLFYNNCEHYTTWVFGNKLASDQCERMEKAVLSVGAFDPRIKQINTEEPPEWLKLLREAPMRVPLPPVVAPPPLPPIQQAVSVVPVVHKASLPSYMKPTVASRLAALPKGATNKKLTAAYYGSAGGSKKTRKRKTRV